MDLIVMSSEIVQKTFREQKKKTTEKTKFPHIPTRQEHKTDRALTRAKQNENKKQQDLNRISESFELFRWLITG